MADHGDGMTVLDSVILVRKCSPEHGLYTQHREVRPGHKLNIHGLRIAAPFDRSVHSMSHAEGCGNIRENLIPFLHLAIERIGEKPAIRKTITDALVEAVPKQNQLGRLL